MMRDLSLYHGAAIVELLGKNTLNIEKIGNTAYLINNQVVYMKYSTKRVSPWNFIFSLSHINEIEKLKEKYDDVYLLLICNKVGVAVISYDEYRKLLAIYNGDISKWIKVEKKKHEQFTLSGTDGRLSNKIPLNRAASLFATHES